MPRKKRYTTAQISAALRANAGLRFQTAKSLKTSQTTLRRYIADSSKLQEVEREVIEASIDQAVNALLKNIDDGKEPSIFFYLKCKGGFREKDEAITLDTLRRIMEELGLVVAKHVKDKDILSSIEKDWDHISF